MGRSQPQPQSAPPVPPEAVGLRRTRDAGVQPRHLYQAAGLLFVLALAYRFFDTLAQTLLLAYAAVILAVGLDAVRKHLPLRRRWFAALAGVAGIAAVVALIWFGAPALLAQARSVAALGPGLETQVAEWEAAIRTHTGLNVDLPSPSGRVRIEGAQGDALGRAVGLVQILFIPVVIFFGALFALADPNQRLLNPVVRAVPEHLRPAFYRILQLLAERLVGWLKGAALSMLAVGLLSIVAFTLIGVPNALLLGTFNGAVEFMPLVGPWIGGAAATLVAFLHDPTQAVWTALAAVAIQQIEANLITPFAMAKEAKIHPFVTLFALVLFGGLFGILGLLLALPLVLLFATVVQVLWVERALDADRDRIRPVVEE